MIDGSSKKKEGGNRLGTRLSYFSSKGIIYWRSIAFAILLTCLPLSLITALYIYFGNQHIIAQYQQQNDTVVSDAAQQIDEQFSRLFHYAVNFVVKPYFKPTLSDTDFAANIEETNGLFDTLTLLANSDPIVDQVYLYIQAQNKIMEPNLGLRTLDNHADAQAFSSLLDNETDIFWTSYIHRPFQQQGASYALVLKLPFNGYTPYGAIIIYVDPSKLDAIRNSPYISMLLDGDDNIIAASEQAASLPTATQSIRDHLQQQQEHELAIHHLKIKAPPNQDTLVVNSIQFEKLQRPWVFVTATPQSVILAPTKPYMHIIFICFLCALIAALLLSWFGSNRFYLPIRNMLMMIRGERIKHYKVYDELRIIEDEWKQYRFSQSSLQQQWQQSLPMIREAYINQFLSGLAAPLTEEGYIAKMGELALDIRCKQFTTIVMQQHRQEAAEPPLTESDQQLLTYAALNVIQELAEQRQVYVHPINFFDGSFGAVLIAPDFNSEQEHDDTMQQFCNQIIRALRDSLRMSVTVVLGQSSSKWTDVPHALMHAKRALQYRYFDAGSQLLEADMAISQKNDWGDFPVELEHEFIHALNLGLQEEAERTLNRFLTALQAGGGSIWHVHHGLLRLITTVHRSMLQAGMNPYHIFDFTNLQEQLTQLRDMPTCMNWFKKEIILPYLDQLEKCFSSAMKSLVEHVLEQIEQNKMLNLSLDAIAMDAQVSVSQLSKAFKQMTGTNYMDYVTTVRLNHCKELLLHTDMQINEIAETAGYNPSYFNRLFKRIEGITPGQFRQVSSSK